ncbi:MAG: hypothetical protein MUE30_04165 [Spirosomaceae bacterium]|jgi:hypothetical protein|nr:hypothetical protein [Spirosomataceae bacterium]
MKKLLFIFALIATFGGLGATAQDTRTDNHTVTVTIPEVALLDLESSGSKNFTLAYVAPTEAGNPITSPTPNNSLWLNYSSIVANTGETSRQVTVQITSGTMPAGVILRVFAFPPTPSLSGGQIALVGFPLPMGIPTTPFPILSNIGSGYTGNGVGAGHMLSYTLDFPLGPSTYGDLKHDNSTTVTVTYTLTDV